MPNLDGGSSSPFTPGLSFDGGDSATTTFARTANGGYSGLDLSLPGSQRFLAVGVAALLSNQSRCRRILLIGDSQETSPGSNSGQRHVAYANYLWWQFFVNCPETPISPITNYGGVADTSGQFLIGCARTNGAASGQGATYQPYNFEGTNPALLAPATEAGVSYAVRHDASFPAGVVLPTFASREYGVRLGMTAEIFVPRLPTNDSQIICLQQQGATNAISFFNTQVASDTISAPDAVGAEGPVRVYRTPTAFQWSTPPAAGNLTSMYGNYLFGSGSASIRTTFLGIVVKFGNTRGLVVSSMSAGGLSSQSILANRAGSVNFIAAYGPDITVFRYGANDSTGLTAAQYATAHVNLIAAIRVVCPGQLCVIMGDPPRNGLTAGQLAEFNGYHAAAAAATAGDQYTRCLDLRTECIRLGYDPSIHTDDGLHPNALGDPIVAQAEYNLLVPLLGYSAGSRRVRTLYTRHRREALT